METTATHSLHRGVAAAALALLALAGCGGGGDGGSSAPGSVNVTAANQDTLSRAGMVALQAGVLGGTAGVAGGGGAAAVALAVRKRPAAVQPPRVEDCAISGTTTTVYDDRDDSGTASAGDVATITYTNCSDVAGEVTNGSIVASYTQVQLATLPASIGANVTTSELRTQTSSASIVAQGGFTMLLRIESPTVDSLHIAVPSAFTMAISTPLYSDTITLLGGYTLDSVYDAAALPPGGTVAGRTSTTAHGPVQSAVAAGYVQVNALQPMLQYDVDPYPRSGQFEVVGKTGSLQAVVLSTAQVEISLDADGNGVFDATKIVAWTDFF